MELREIRELISLRIDYLQEHKNKSNSTEIKESYGFAISNLEWIDGEICQLASTNPTIQNNKKQNIVNGSIAIGGYKISFTNEQSEVEK